MKRFKDIYEKKLYHCWADMKTRCYNPNCHAYKNYGARGIIVCDRWKNSFENFQEDLRESYIQHVQEYGFKNTTIDRDKVNLNYEPSNCFWRTNQEQRINVRDKEIYEIINLETNEKEVVNNLMEWVRQHKLNRSHVYDVIMGRWTHYKEYTFKKLN